LTIGFVHWYVGFEIWTKEDIAIAAKHEKTIADIIAEVKNDRPKKKAPAKKKK
jgi:hypothetical protein